MLGLVVAVALLALASSAEAATVAVGPANRVTYTDPPGSPVEANNVVVSADATNLIFQDSGAAITAGAGCAPALQGATCPKAGILFVAVVTNEGDDQITINLSPSDVAAGARTILQTGDGDDYIVGSPLRDDINAGAGGDTVNSGGGVDDSVAGGSGPDTITFADRPANVDVEAEIRGVRPFNSPHAKEIDSSTSAVVGSVRTMPDFENVIGGAGDDVLIGSHDANVIVGGDGADVLCGALGNDTVSYGGFSNRYVSYPASSGPVHVSLDGDPGMPTDPLSASQQQQDQNRARLDCRAVDDAQGTATPGKSFNPGDPGFRVDCAANDGGAGDGTADCVGEDVENVIGTSFDDVLDGNDATPIYGQGPSVEPSGINHLEGRGGNDVLDGSLAPDVLDGGSGNDTVSYSSRTDPIKASLDGAANDGGIGDLNPAYPDAVQGDAIGTDVENITGGAGSDLLSGDDSANALNGGDGNDIVSGNGGNDNTLSGGNGDDSLSGGDGSDTLDGGPGADELDGGFGGDALSGGDGVDLVNYSNEITPVSATPNGAADDGSAFEGDNLGGDVESLTGGPAGDVLVGNGGNGTLSGGGGDDLLDGGGGADAFSGGTGIDGVTYAGRTAPVFVDLEVAGGAGEAGEGDVVGGDVERLIGGAGPDKLSGNGGMNVLIGNGGNDTLSGGGGPDSAFGGPGNDTVNGDEGNDSVYGDEGADKLFGGSGADREDGGGGDDSLDGGVGSDVLNGGPGMDAAVYSGRSKDVEADVHGNDNSGEKNEKDQIRTTVEGARTGGGDDTINIRDGGKGQASCGKGIDVVMADRTDQVGADCEQVNVLASGRCSVRTGSATMSRNGTVGIRLTCPVAAKGRLRLIGGGATLGSKRFSLKAGKSKMLKVKLSKKGRRIVKRKKRLKASATVKPSGKVAVKSSTKRVTIRTSKGKR
jgi:Ca2+-binding RTX toxin-like protein